MRKLRRSVACGENTDISRAKLDIRSPQSTISVGRDCLIEGTLVTETAGSEIRIANNVYIGSGTILDCATSIIVEDDVLVSYGCILADSDNHSLRYSLRKHDLADWRQGKIDWSQHKRKSAPIRVSKGVWIGARVIILKGVTIGEGAVVGAGSVVSRDVPAWTVVAGNPARVVLEIPEDER